MGVSASGCGEGLLRSTAPIPKTITLKYFPIAGRAEPIRLALVLGKISFYDQRVPGLEWDNLKPSTPFGQVPVLVVDSKNLCQTKAILRFVGRLARYRGLHLYPQDAWVGAKVDELLDVFDDLWALLAPTYTVEDQPLREEMRKTLFGPGGPAVVFLEGFEKTLAGSRTGHAIPQAGFSVADLMLFTFLNVLRSGFVDGLGKNLYADYPNIMKHKEMVANLPEVSAYYRDESRSNPNGVPNYTVFLPEN